MQLPSRFQIGDTVTVKRESRKVSHASIKVAGVQFTEGKVAYLFDEGPDTDHYFVVNSELVEELHPDQPPPSE